MSRLSPAQQHRQRVLSVKAAEQSTHGGVVSGSAYELMLIKLATDRQQLKSIQSIQRKIELKRELVAGYQDWLDAAISKGNGAQDMIVSTLLVWHIDIGDFQRALQIAYYMMQHDMPLPDQYNRNLATLMLDEIPDAYIKAEKIDADAVNVLKTVDFLTADKDAPDQARAKLHKALAYAYVQPLGEEDLLPEQVEQAQLALTEFNKALALFESIGVKKDIERLERRLKKATQG